MEFLPKAEKGGLYNMINFLRFKWYYLAFSSALLLVGIISMVRNGFVYSVEFSGGGAATYRVMKNPQNVSVSSALKQQLPHVEIQGENSVIVVKGKDLHKKQAEEAASRLKPADVRLEQFDRVGPSISADNIQRIVVAIICAILVMLVYIGFAFRGVSYAVAAVLAAAHDTLILLGAWSLFGFWGAQFDVLFVTSVLTVMSFSVHDTIIIFDKIKEEQRVARFGTLEEQINSALTLTISRSINNSLTIILMLSALVLLGGGSVQWFGVSLLIGSVVGTYSSPFVATPLFYFLTRSRKAKH